MDKNILAVALGSMLLGGVAVAAYHSMSNDSPAASFQPLHAQQPAVGGTQLDSSSSLQARIAPTAPQLAAVATPQVEYADVVDVNAVRKSSARYASVIGVDPVRETSTTSSPREVCNDVVVQERLPERDGNVGGTVVGALVGGLVGNRVGAGNGRKLATVAGAVGGGFIGNRVDRNHIGGRVVDRVDHQCHTITDTSRSSRTVAYTVTYRNPDGTVGTERLKSRPGSRIRVGTDNAVVGYDVTYRYGGAEHTVRMDERPGARLPVVGGRVVTGTAVASRG
ncbi:glycine zipper 2TM domain-containing protein [Cognatilysobacter lacus]|uniref:Glycine zipper 2TM domain-containing protein n=1 Tax=Cognatilysobacter lacus TaxID=1643323 RepID=A0A5D8Z602_9GAMM|nr:glycine zipper 2TM domain-containing protein [Lysobacter lacus]TZF90179.1 glycine zipper 2TM domain-containing protein [Lysobacter lacus]